MDKQAVIPKYIAEWLEFCKRNEFTLFGCLDPALDFEELVNESFKGDIRKCIRWCRKESNTLARAWLDGYEVEKEKKYIVKFKNIIKDLSFLKYDGIVKKWYFGRKGEVIAVRLHHTEDELTEGGFEWVFSCKGVEVEEVEDDSKI